MKKILIVSTVQAPPIQAGNQKCILEYCNLLKHIGCEVYYLYVEGRNHTSDVMCSYWGEHLHIYKKKMWLEFFKRVIVTLRSKVLGYNYVDDLYPIGLTKYVETLQKKIGFDGIIINYVNLSKLFKAKLNCRKILFAHDCMSFKKIRLNLNSFWFDLTPDQEAKGLQRCDVVLSIQDNETTYFKYLHPKGKILTVYSNFEDQRQAVIGNKNILFLSGKSILNINGIKYFIKEIFPLVLQKEPDAKLLIGGSICDVLPEINNTHIVLMGHIDDAKSFYALGDIAINPIYQGTGLKIKTFEALSFGKTTIVHSHSAEGIYDSQHAPILLGRTPAQFAGHLIKVLSNIDIRKIYSDRAVEYIQNLNHFIEMQYLHVIE